MKHNIVLDFSSNSAVSRLTEEQPMAVMPAVLAKRLLQILADNLAGASLEHIVESHITDLRQCNSLDEVLATSVSFLQERELIDAVEQKDWDRYAVEPVQTGDSYVSPQAGYVNR